MQTKEEALAKLKKSKFRSSFHLDEKDIAYIEEKGMDRIRIHAEDFVRKRLAPPAGQGDGKQTPFRGHPVFKAQHACAFCCRNCMKKWYKVDERVELSEDIQRRIVDFLMFWIENNK